MKRMVICVFCLIFAIIGILPLITGDLEKEELNPAIRVQLEGSFV